MFWIAPLSRHRESHAAEERVGGVTVATKIKTEESFGWWTKTGHLHVQYCVNDMSAKDFVKK